jgi:hypothetical protein
MWGDYNLEYASMYPYQKVKNIQPSGENDTLLHERELTRVLASIGRFGEIVTGDTRRDLLQAIDMNPLTFEIGTRLCADELEPDDVGYFVKVSSVSEDTVAVRNLAKMINPSTFKEKGYTHDLENLSKYTEVVVYDVVSPTKSVIFRTTIHERNPSGVDILVDGYFLGDISLDEVEPKRDLLQQLMSYYFPETTAFRFKRRLHVPIDFCGNVAFMTYLFVCHLKDHGNYLQISRNYMMRMKLEMTEMIEVLELHDSFLGQLRLDEIDETAHPFITTEYKDTDNLEDLETMGWRVVDVEGDGNCGFYVVILGLENNGIREYYVDTRRKGIKNITESEEWIRQLGRIRKAMRSHSEHMLTVIYPKEQRNYEEQIWWGAEILEEKHVDGYMDEKRKD